MAEGLKAEKGFSSQWRSEKDLERLLPAIAAAGFAGVEPTFNTGAIPSPDSYPAQAKVFARRCRDLGLRIPSLRGGMRFWDTIPSPEPAERAKALEHAKKALECLALLGGENSFGRPRENPPGNFLRRPLEEGGGFRKGSRRTGESIGIGDRTGKRGSPASSLREGVE